MDEPFRWDPNCSVNIAELDHQHQTLFLTVEELEFALRRGSADSIIDEVLNRATQVIAHSDGFVVSWKNETTYHRRLSHHHSRIAG
jgi:hemerythrin